MKKQLTLIAAAMLVFSGTIPAKADITFDGRTDYWGGYYAASWATISVDGSIQEGGIFQIKVEATIPNELVCSTSWVKIANGGVFTQVAQNVRGTYSQTMNNLVAGAAGTGLNYTGLFVCVNSNDNTRSSWATPLAKITFEAAIGTPSNFSVSPQSAGTAFTTWGIANGATSYTVTAAPGGRSCTTTQNFCTVTGLTNGETYTFTLTATNGTASSSVGSGPVVLRQPVNVAVALNGGTWKVGETVTAQVVVQGSSATPQITWYRCNNPVGTMPVAPAPSECTTISSGSSATYMLATLDIGKYITSNVFINGTDPQGQMTANSNTAVLASSAVIPTPTPAPDGSPTIVGIPNRIVPITGGTQITITGTGLAGVTSVTIGGVVAEVVTKSDTSLIVKVPTSSQTGAVDLVITNAKGTATEKSAVIYSSTQTPVTPVTPITPVNPVITKITKTLSVTSFTASQVKLSTAQKAAVKKLIAANPTLTQLTCAAKTTGKSVTSKDLSNAKARATATCAYAASLRSNLFVKASGSASIGNATSRNVLLSLKN